MVIDYKNKLLNLKIVYYGPALSGKTTNLEYIHAHTDPNRRTNLVSLRTAEDRTLYFDFMQLELGRICGLVPVIQLYTVPGQTYYQSSRKVVLKGADGIVFVADSTKERAQDNLESWRDLHIHMREQNLPETTPIVIQLNKLDANPLITSRQMCALLRAYRIPMIGALAVYGNGVHETLKSICSETIRSIQMNPNPSPSAVR